MSYHVHSEGVDGRACGGVSVLVKTYIPHRQISLNTNLQAVAVVLSRHTTITIGSIYIPPRYQLGNRELNDLLDQLPSPFILIGDMNAHNITWGNLDNNSKGDKLEKLISDYDLCLWNDGCPTYIHPISNMWSTASKGPKHTRYASGIPAALSDRALCRLVKNMYITMRALFALASSILRMSLFLLSS